MFTEIANDFQPRTDISTVSILPTSAGPLLNRAARVLANAATGQVVVDEPTWMKTLDHAQKSLLVGISLGEFHLKGLDEPVVLYHVSKEVPTGPA